LLAVYYGCFQSVMSYDIEVWGGSAHTKRAFLEHKRAIRIISGLSPSHSCRGVFRQLNILTLSSLYILKVVLLVKQKLGSLQTVGENHRYPTRNGTNLLPPQIHLSLSSLKNLETISYNRNIRYHDCWKL
jgi:hypothetical protein